MTYHLTKALAKIARVDPESYGKDPWSSGGAYKYDDKRDLDPNTESELNAGAIDRPPVKDHPEGASGVAIVNEKRAAEDGRSATVEPVPFKHNKERVPNSTLMDDPQIQPSDKNPDNAGDVYYDKGGMKACWEPPKSLLRTHGKTVRHPNDLNAGSINEGLNPEKPIETARHGGHMDFAQGNGKIAGEFPTGPILMDAADTLVDIIRLMNRSNMGKPGRDDNMNKTSSEMLKWAASGKWDPSVLGDFLNTDNNADVESQSYLPGRPGPAKPVKAPKTNTPAPTSVPSVPGAETPATTPNTPATTPNTPAAPPSVPAQGGIPTTPAFNMAGSYGKGARAFKQSPWKPYDQKYERALGQHVNKMPLDQSFLARQQRNTDAWAQSERGKIDKGMAIPEGGAMNLNSFKDADKYYKDYMANQAAGDKRISDAEKQNGPAAQAFTGALGKLRDAIGGAIPGGAPSIMGNMTMGRPLAGSPGWGSVSGVASGDNKYNSPLAGQEARAQGGLNRHINELDTRNFFEKELPYRKQLAQGDPKATDPRRLMASWTGSHPEAKQPAKPQAPTREQRVAEWDAKPENQAHVAQRNSMGGGMGSKEYEDAVRREAALAKSENRAQRSVPSGGFKTASQAMLKWANTDFSDNITHGAEGKGAGTASQSNDPTGTEIPHDDKSKLLKQLKDVKDRMDKAAGEEVVDEERLKVVGHIRKMAADDGQSRLGQFGRGALAVGGAGLIAGGAAALSRGPLMRMFLNNIKGRQISMIEQALAGGEMDSVTAKAALDRLKSLDVKDIEKEFYSVLNKGEFTNEDKPSISAENALTLGLGAAGGVVGAGAAGAAQIAGGLGGKLMGSRGAGEKPSSMVTQTLVPGTAGYDIGRA